MFFVHDKNGYMQSKGAQASVQQEQPTDVSFLSYFGNLFSRSSISEIILNLTKPYFERCLRFSKNMFLEFYVSLKQF